MKGVANWIIIMGSVVIGLIILFIGTTLIIKQMKMSEKQSVLENIQELYNKIENVCNLGKGTIIYYNIAIPNNVRAVYVTNSSYSLPPDKVSSLITGQRKSEGNYLCVQFFNDNLPICQKLGCMANFTYIGSPSLKIILQTLIASIKGDNQIFEYNMKIEKTNDYFIDITSNPFFHEYQ